MKDPQMSNKVYLSNSDVIHLASDLAESLPSHCKVYGIPRGGVPVAYLLRSYRGINVTSTPEEADILVDDIIDSGVTASEWGDRYGKPVRALVDRVSLQANGLTARSYLTGWLVFPWEGDAEGGHRR